MCASVQILQGPILIPPLNPKARPAGHTSPHCQVLMATAGGQVQHSSPISCLLQQHQCGEINPTLFKSLTVPCQHAPPHPQYAKPLLHLHYQEVYQTSVFKTLNVCCGPFHRTEPITEMQIPHLETMPIYVKALRLWAGTHIASTSTDNTNVLEIIHTQQHISNASGSQTLGTAESEPSWLTQSR